MYVNGVLVNESAAVTISPLDFKPVLNYIGRSQFSDPLFNGYIDEFSVYNYALSANEVAQISGALANGISGVASDSNSGLSLWPMPANDVLNISFTAENSNSLSSLTVYNASGRLVLSRDITSTAATELRVSDLPSGIYLLKLTTGKATMMKKFIVNH